MNTGKWIYYHTGEKKRPDSIYGNPSPYFRKEFRIRGNVSKVTLSVAALGVFKAYVNGQSVSDDYLSPGRCDYNKRIPVIEYDITDFVTNENAVGIVCGDGWAVGSIPFGDSFRRNCYSDEIYLYSNVCIEYDDGTKNYISTDKSWKVSTGAVRYSSVYFGECIDNNYSVNDFSKFGFNDSNWAFSSEDMYSKSNLLTRFEGVPIMETGLIKPVKTENYGGKTVYDFGKEMSGSVKITVSGRKNDTVKVYYSLTGSFDENTGGCDTFILCGENSEVFKTLFTVHNFRFAAIESAVKPADVTACEITAQIERTGDFYCSDNRLTELFVNSYRRSKSGFLSIPEDSGVASVNADKALFDMYTFGAEAFYKKYLSDIRDSQLANGFVSSAVPVMQYGYRKLYGSFASDNPIKMVYNHFMMYGDTEVLKQNIHMCKKLCEYIEENTDDLLTLASVYMYMSGICTAIGDFDGKLFREKYTAVKMEFRKEFADGHTKTDMQRDYVEAYLTGILTADEITQPLLNTVKRSDDIHPELLKVLCEIGESGKAYELLCKNPKDFSNFSSLAWFYSGILGINPADTPDGAGFKKVIIEPAIDLSDNIRKAGGSLITPYGKISVYWEKNDDIYTCCLTVPFEIDATCRFSGFKVINQKCSRETYVFAMRKVIR